MRTTSSYLIRSLLLAAALSAALPVAAASFVYRGTLTDGGEPAEGQYGFRLSFYNAQTGGKALAAPIMLDEVAVSNGTFNTGLDLDPALQRRETLWLEVEVRDADGAFVQLADREAVQPNALKAAGMCWGTTGNTGTFAAGNFLGTTDGAALRLQSTGGVGVNTPAPLATLHVRFAPSGAIAPVGGSVGVFESNSHTYLSVFSPPASERGILFGKPTSFNDAADGGIIYNNVNSSSMQFRTGGNVTRMQLGVSDVDGGGMGDFAEPNLQLFGSGGTNVYFKPHIDSSLGLGVLDIGFTGIQSALRVYALFVRVAALGFVVDGSASKPGGGPWSDSSDLRLKKNIVPLEGALDRLLALRGVNFEYTHADSTMHPAGVRTGFVAQEVQKVFPQWVQPGTDGYLTVGSHGFEALTVEALRQLARENEQLQVDNAQLHTDNAELRARMDRLERLLSRR